MSKSKGETLTVSLLIEKGYNPLSYRYFCLGSHYRNQLVFSYESLDGAENAYNKLKSKIKSLSREPNLENDKTGKYIDQFKDAIRNDLNTSSMLTTVYDVLKDEDLSDFTKLYLIDSFDKVLSLDLIEDKEEINEELKNKIEEKIIERNKAKAEKNYAKADEIRNELLEKGIILKDTREGTIYEV